jgi:co-chaperonin GroES (HSP10)
MKALNDIVILVPMAVEATTESGIIATSKKAGYIGAVIEIGPKVETVKVGDTVVFKVSQSERGEIPVEGGTKVEARIFLKEEAIYAIL